MKFSNPYVMPFLRRFFILAVISLAGVFLVSEIAFRLMGNSLSRGPQEVQLVIPAGTAQRLAAGQQTDIPDAMIFVQGDKLVVKNEDSVQHVLGPLFIPAGQSASMNLDAVSDTAYECSFQTTRYFGLTVKEAITWGNRLSALWYGGMPTWMLLLVYSLVARPLKPEGLAKV